MAHKRIDPADHGIDLPALLEEIRPHLTETQQATADRAGMTQPYLAELLGGKKPPTLASLAALADAAGGRLEVKFHPPKKRKAKQTKARG